MPDKVIVFDTTLRDAEQTPGAALYSAEKFEIAKHLAQLNVDVIEAGFPRSSPSDFEAVQRISNEIERISNKSLQISSITNWNEF